MMTLEPYVHSVVLSGNQHAKHSQQGVMEEWRRRNEPTDYDMSRVTLQR